MASFVLENHESIVGFELNTDSTSALLLSQLLDEESHVEDCDDERLTRVIRSLEAEIIEPIMMIEDDGSFMELEWDDNFVEIGNYVSNGLQEDVMITGDCSTPSDFDDVDNYNWMDMEEKTEFGGLGDDYFHYCQYDNDSCNANHNRYVTSNLEEQSYGSLWQDTNVLVM
ncbi:Ribonuclease [Heracleum sosnowskyi]|uniref:Ribonuclease n=1 Tax=Heracleum sosnowskyi TaxID=360622 RepID=A0AAD8JB96_9APIA|nr:Ribonuclease [Heracleum sosnowskyi]